MAVSDDEFSKNELVDDGLRGKRGNAHHDHNDDDPRPDSKYNVNGKKVYTSSRHYSSVVDTRSGGKRNDHVKEFYQEDNTYNSSRRADGGRVDNSGALIASGDGKELPTTIHPSSYGTHGLLISGNHDDNNAHHVRGS